MAFEKEDLDMNQWFSDDSDKSDDDRTDEGDTSDEFGDDNDTYEDDNKDDSEENINHKDDADTDSKDLEKSIERYLNTGLKMVDKLTDIINGNKKKSEPSGESKKKISSKDYEDIPIDVPTQKKPRKALPAKRTAASDHETDVLDDVRRAMENAD